MVAMNVMVESKLIVFIQPAFKRKINQFICPKRTIFMQHKFIYYILIRETGNQ